METANAVPVKHAGGRPPGPVIKGPRRHMEIYIKAELHDGLVQCAEEDGLKPSAWLRDLIRRTVCRRKRLRE